MNKTTIKAFILVGALSVSLSPANAADLKLPLLWTSNLATFLESAATLADINGDGDDEVLVAGREEIFALDGNGKELWRWRTKVRFMTGPAVLSRDGKSPLIYIADSSGLFTCLDGTGKEVWHAQLNGPSSCSTAALCDLDSDGKPEVVQTDEKGTVWAFEALTGKPIWQAQVKGAPVNPAVGDFNGDGKAETVVVTGDGIATAITHDGNLMWERDIGGFSPTWHTSAPVIFASSDGSGRIAAASNTGHVFCFDSEGTVLWQHPTRGPVAATISVGDLDLDGRADIFLITQLGVVYRFDETGNVLWEIDMQGRSLAPGAIIDINGDKQLEYVLCTQRGLLLVLNETGEIIFDYQFNNRTINVTPTFGDVTADSPGLEMLITGGEAGNTFCFGTQAPVDTLAQWPVYRCNPAMTGSWFGLTRTEAVRMIPDNLSWNRIFTGEDIRFIIHNPDPDKTPLKATAVCVRPDGARQSVVTTVLGKHGELLLPVGAIAPGTHQFSWFLEDAEGKLLFSDSKEASLQPFVNDRALVRQALNALTESADAADEKLPLSAAALRDEAVLLEIDSEAAVSLQEAVPGGDTAVEESALQKTADLVVRARRALGLSNTIRQVVDLGPRTSLIAFEGTVWENREVDRQLPAYIESPLKITRRVVPGEHDPISLNLLNITNRSLNIRTHIESPDEKLVVTPHRSVSVPTSLGEVSWDAMPELDETGIITIPSLTSRELWLDVKIGNIEPGDYRISVRLQAIDGAGVLDTNKNPQPVTAPEIAVEITLNILPFEMAAPGAMRLCTWAPADSFYVEDLLSHGNNVFTAPSGAPQFDQQDKLVGVDYTRLDSIIDLFHGADVIFLLQGIPSLRGELGSAAYQENFNTFLNDLVKHMAEKGIDTDHFGLYPLDEPGGHGWHAVDQMVEFGKIVREANPDVMVYVDGGGELPMFEAMAPYIDIWCPGIFMLPEDSPEMKVIRSTGKMIWSYNCGYSYARPVGPNLKNINIIAEYRTAALFAFRFDTTGIGYWCYNSGGDPWTRVEHEYMLVYPGRSGPVTSRRWEAVREGIEDFRILTALKERLNATGNARLKEDARARIGHLLEISLPEMIDQSFKEMNIGLGRNVMDASNSDATMNAFRKEMMDCVSLLNAG
ncbi:MAG: PQQ-binding-like beta-propeller repeat protein [bacterium]